MKNFHDETLKEFEESFYFINPDENRDREMMDDAKRFLTSRATAYQNLLVQRIEGEIWESHSLGAEDDKIFTDEQKRIVNNLCMKSHNGGVVDIIALIKKM